MSSLPIGLAAIEWQPTVAEGLERIDAYERRSADEDVDIVSFPETYLPGPRGSGFDLPEPDQSRLEAVLERLRDVASRNDTATIVGMEWLSDRGLENQAYVLSGMAGSSSPTRRTR